MNQGLTINPQLLASQAANVLHCLTLIEHAARNAREGLSLHIMHSASAAAPTLQVSRALPQSNGRLELPPSPQEQHAAMAGQMGAVSCESVMRLFGHIQGLGTVLSGASSKGAE